MMFPSRSRTASYLQPMMEDQELIGFNRDRRRSSGSIIVDSFELGNVSPSRRSSIASTLPVDKKSRRKLSTPVPLHQYTEDPTLAWEMLKEKRPVKPVRQMRLDTPVKPDHVRFVCIGCTHGEQMDLSKLPPGDVLLVAGDFTSCGLPNEVHSFNKLLGKLKYAYKVVIGGNHECTFDDTFLKLSEQILEDHNDQQSQFADKESEPKEMALKQAMLSAIHSDSKGGISAKELLSNAIYLEDNVIELFGITIYGTPWQPKVDNWAFNLSRGQSLLDKWNMIPTGVDVLLTHTPPLGHGDMMNNGQRMGCVELLNTVFKRVRPKYHVFGHIHEGYGCTTDGYTKFINCCQCNENLDVKNEPVIFDIPVHPHTKQFYVQNVKKILKRFQKKN
ncbi:Protein CBG03200 [Caenorhabditis briggsae]|uniref:Protein CBG03200 n=1 Tax=Caenorhabditis briggsae TaxID=6238 RepID=A8WSK2_CAEBR|nr:Protein CBG03200 [Caenorhabditis briggsae]CAP23461.2 Protein CBG03200 [Caenorhabditis briggsae]